MYSVTGFEMVLRRKVPHYLITWYLPSAMFVLVSWISLLDSVPDSEMVRHLPEFLDPLFHILDDPSPEISTLCDNLLGEFLGHIIEKPEVVDFPSMINTLITHSQSESNVQLQVDM